MDTPSLYILDHPFRLPAGGGDTCAFWYNQDCGFGLTRQQLYSQPHICGNERRYHKYERKDCPWCGKETALMNVRPGWLREERKRRGVSLRTAAKHLGMSASYLSDIELGRRCPKEGKKEAICAYYDSLTMRGPEEG